MKRMLKIVVLCALMVSIASSGFCGPLTKPKTDSSGTYLPKNQNSSSGTYLPKKFDMPKYIEENFTAIDFDDEDIEFDDNPYGIEVNLPFAGKMAYVKASHTLIKDGIEYDPIGFAEDQDIVLYMYTIDDEVYSITIKDDCIVRIIIYEMDGMTIDKFNKLSIEDAAHHSWMFVDFDSRGYKIERILVRNSRLVG